ncbi:uncharacterized protein KY384_003088 [Bacidia gigantensis]|uniref:uncharacterized protein n=1 Tax=Bacidia gigantensis TaxID=2732470 RepID=UPI001D040E3C|nr:uncharacterized protein KY384_003088 [Bacidia gigantensis]KAG8531459.1 hypothetical protein KY384_003088 [Bacidia gigantensis]
MADPFDVRMRFTHQLQNLNASSTASQKAAHYALKNRDMDEDLHSCILEQLELTSMNIRANIMYFIEHLCDMAQREQYPGYVTMMQRDIVRVVDAVSPADGSGAANLKVVRKVLLGLQSKSVLQSQTVQEIEEGLKERDTISGPNAALSPRSPNTVNTLNAPSRDDHSVHAGSKANGVTTRLDKRQIEQRIEEDRERHKRLREDIWAVGGDENQDEEFEKMWEEVSDLGSDDYLQAEEEAEERRLALEMG